MASSTTLLMLMSLALEIKVTFSCSLGVIRKLNRPEKSGQIRTKLLQGINR